MNNVIVVEAVHSTDNLSEVFSTFAFLNTPSHDHKVVETPIGAILCHKVVAVLRFNEVEQSHNVVMLDTLKKLHFSGHLLEDIRVNCLILAIDLHCNL